MKAIGIKMVEFQPMTGGEAMDNGYSIGTHNRSEKGYELTYPDGYKSWTPKDVFDSAYYPLSEDNDGTKILKEDVENFITDVEVMTIGKKTTVVNAHTLTGFDTVRHSSCVDPKNYSEELGKEYTMIEVVDSLWSHLEFVLQWAKYGLKEEIKNTYPPHIQRIIDENNQLIERSIKLGNFITNNPIFKNLPIEEQEAMKEQLVYMNKYSNVLTDRLLRAGVKLTKY